MMPHLPLLIRATRLLRKCSRQVEAAMFFAKDVFAEDVVIILSRDETDR